MDLVVVSIGTTHHRSDGQIKSTLEQRRDELGQAVKVLGIASAEVMFENMDGQLDTMPRYEIISRLDGILDRGYDQIYFPYASHHQDHQVVYESCFSALRQGARKNNPSLAAMYEYTYIGWLPMGIQGGHYYVDISSFMGKKIVALQCYASQLSTPDHPISAQSIESLARMRGMESGFTYAEMFYLVRMVKGMEFL